MIGIEIPDYSQVRMGAEEPQALFTPPVAIEHFGPVITQRPMHPEAGDGPLKKAGSYP